MLRSLETRLAKLEAARRPSAARFFVLWSREAEGDETALANALASGAITKGDPLIRFRWPFPEEGVPASRWVSDRDLTRREDDALAIYVRARVCELGSDPDAPTKPTRPDDKMLQLSDEQLYAAIFAEPA